MKELYADVIESAKDWEYLGGIECSFHELDHYVMNK
jgi:hypothetical protein